MKTIIILITGLCLIMNILCGCIISSYSAFNCGITSGVIILNAIIMLIVSEITLKDGYRISLNVLFPIMVIVEFVVGLFSPDRIQDNISLVFILIALLLKGIIIIITNQISKNYNYEQSSKSTRY